MNQEIEALSISSLAAEITRIVADRIRAAAGDRVTIALADLQQIHLQAYTIHQIDLESQQKSSPRGGAAS